MGFVKFLLDRRAESCRKAMRRSYEKHLRLARQNSSLVKEGDSPHIVGLYGALGSRYLVGGETINEMKLWSELGPFLLMNENDAIEDLAEYVVYKEQPREAKARWLKELINERFRVSSASERSIRFVPGVMNQVKWCNLLDTDIMKYIEEEIATRVISESKENTEKSSMRESNILKVLQSRRVWKKLPSGFLIALTNKLNSVEKATEFAELCEKSGILENNIVGIIDLSKGDPEFAIGAVAVTLTSYGNFMNDQRQFSEAKRALELALLLKPRHVPAWSSMAMVSLNIGDCETAVSWADRVLTFKPDPDSDDSWERAATLSMTEEADSIYAEMLRLSSKKPNQAQEAITAGGWKQIQELMRTVKKTCSK